MKKIAQETFDQLLTESSIKPRLRKDLRFIASTENLNDELWSNSELIGISNRSGNAGVLLLDLDSGFYIVPYELKTGITSSTTGRSQSVICDLCRTWQYGDKSGSITFAIDKKSSVSYLCCADLKCSLHVRTMTKASLVSRAQLREDLSPKQRVARLHNRLASLMDSLPFESICLC